MAFIAATLCGALFTVYGALAPKVGGAAAKEHGKPPSLLDKATSYTVPPGGSAERIPESKVVAQWEFEAPANSDATLEYLDEVLPIVESIASPLSDAVLDAKRSHELGANGIDTFLALLASTDAFPNDPAVAVAAELGSTLFQSMQPVEIDVLSSYLPPADALGEGIGVYTSATSLYVVKVRAEFAKAFGDTPHEIEYRRSLADGILNVARAHIGDTAPHGALCLIELLREHRDAVAALDVLEETSTDLTAIHEDLLTRCEPNAVTCALHAWLALHYATGGRDHALAQEHADAALKHAEAPHVMPALDTLYDPGSGRGKLELLVGRAYHTLARFEDAQNHFAWISARYPGTPVAVDAEYFRSQAIYAASEYRGDLAGNELQKFLDNFPESPHTDQVRLNLGNLHTLDGNTACAIEMFRTIADSTEPSAATPKALTQLAMAYSMTGDDKSAAAALERVLNEYPESRQAGEALTRLSHVKIALEDIDAGIAVYDDYLRNHPEGSLSDLARGEGERLEAQRDAAVSVGLAPEIVAQ